MKIKTEPLTSDERKTISHALRYASLAEWNTHRERCKMNELADSIDEQEVLVVYECKEPQEEVV